MPMQSVTTGPSSKHIGHRRAPEALSWPQSWWPGGIILAEQTLEITVLIKNNLLLRGGGMLVGRKKAAEENGREASLKLLNAEWTHLGRDHN